MTSPLNLGIYARAVALALGVALTVTPVSALAHTPRHIGPRHTQVSAHVDVSGQALSVQVKAAGGSRCTLQISAGHSSTPVAPITLGESGRGAFHWTIPANAPSGTWTFSISCVRRGHVTRTHTQLALINHSSGGPLSTGGPEGGGKGAGNVSCAQIATPPGGEACFTNDPFAVYQGGEDVGQCTWYAAGMRPDLDGITTGNAGEWLREASGKVPEGSVPVVGAIAVNTTAAGGLGHVAYVAGIKNGGATLILDEANLNYDGRVYLNIETPASEFQGYIYGGPAGNGPGSGTPPPPAPEPSPSPAPTPGPPSPSSPAPAPAQTYAETTGSVVHTWTDYSDAGGTEGPEIPSNDTVQIACKVTGFTVEDGNTWWYRIASAPWNGDYYGSADAFYNNGQTSGSLLGTPFVDPAVPNC
jgi:hypothetical protein